jgi:RHS repeat-associated protein
MRQNRTHSKFLRTVSVALMTALVWTSLPVEDLVAAATEQQKQQLQAPERSVVVNRTVPKVEPIPAFPVFTPDPKDDEFFRARVFEEPLVPMGNSTSVEENRALAAALLSYLRAGASEDLSPIVAFLVTHPESAWRVSLLTNMGIAYRHTGRFTKALSVWERAWTLGKDETLPVPHAIADRAVAEWARLSARLGRYEVLEPVFKEIETRDMVGSAAEKIRQAKHASWVMLNRPEEAFRCGALALDRMLTYMRGAHDIAPIRSSRSTIRGMSLSQILDLSNALGMNLQMAHRGIGADVLFPAIIHWKVGHYATLLKEQDGRYLIQDPALGDELWISRAALEEESSGYFLVPAGNLPQSWQTVSAGDGDQIWGKGDTTQDDGGGLTPNDNSAHGGGGSGGGGESGAGSGGDGGRGPGGDGGQGPTMCMGMAVYDIHLMLVNLNINDSPVGYTPPRGPDVRFMVTYNHRESFQPSVFSYSNLGPQWTFNWLSYVKDDPSNPNATAYVYREGGSDEAYTGFNSSTQSYAPQFMSHATMVRTSSSPIRYERRLRDGAVEVFAQADGAASFPRRIFMTEWRDASGNALTFTYDSSLRLVAVTDAIGQVTTLSYELSSDPLKITKVTDPFGRYAKLDYNTKGRLQRITDIIGIQSEFTYSDNDFILTMTTPYGRTAFWYQEEGRRRWLEATDPMGATEHVEFYPQAPSIPFSDPVAPTGLQIINQGLYWRNSFYWNKRAWALYPGDYTKATIYHWLHGIDGSMTSRLLESMKKPLENRIWYDYPGQNIAYETGTASQPIAIGRVLDDGSSQVSRYEYNAIGKTTKATDPLGRESVFVYGTNNVADSDPATGTSVDLLEVKQKNGAGYDVLQTTTYNAQHLPLTATDAARQTTTFTYRTTGDLETIVTPARGSLTQAERTTTFTYYADNAPLGPGRVQRITGPVSGATTDFAYDSYGRARTVTESDGYALTTDYDTFDRPTRVTYPDGTYEENVYDRLDLSRSHDRLGRWTYFFYDALRRLVLTRDTLGRSVTQEWCNCGALNKLIDANGNTTRWDRDLQSRVTKEVRADNSETLFVYETSTNRLKRRTDPRGQYRDNTYFKDDNIQQISYPNAIIATPTVSFTYDANYNRVATMVDGTGTTSYTYHPVTTGGTPGATQLATVDGPLSNDVISYAYDELSRSLSRSINSVAAGQTYDLLGRIQSETNALGTFTNTFVNQTGRVQSVSYPNGQTTSYSYFANSGDRRLQEILNQKTGAVTISKFNYTYDVVGNIKTWTQQTDSNPAKVYDLVYDPADQLTSATWRTTDPTPSILKRYNYAYDPSGNRTTEQIDDAPLKATYSNMNRLQSQDPGGTLRFTGTVSEAAIVTIQSKPATVKADNTFGGTAIVSSGTSSIEVKATDYTGNTRTNTYNVNAAGSTKTFTHDANGDMTGDGTRTFEWDAENRILAVNNGTHRSEFTYDGLSRRVRIIEKDNSVTTSDVRFVWCELELCEERDSTGATVNKRFYDQGMQEGTDSFYYTRDHLGSLREMTDNAQTLRARYDYDPYGQQTKVSGDKDSSFGFTGLYFHTPSGIILAPYRVYEPTIGKWLSEDPLGLSGDSLQLYGYVRNTPTNLTDPLGLYELKPGVAKPSPAIEDLLTYVEKSTGLTLRVTETSGRHDPTNPHTKGSAVDFTYSGPNYKKYDPVKSGRILSAASEYGIGYGLDEYIHPSRGSTGSHIHLQIPPGRQGGRGDLPPRRRLRPQDYSCTRR